MTAGPCGVRLAGVADLDLVAALQAASFDEIWGREGLAKLWATPGAFALLGLVPGSDGDLPAGYVLARMAADECEILSIGVAASARRRGVGRTLVAAILAEAAARGARRLYLEVAEDNVAARGLYLAFGFRETGRRPGYYRRGGGAVDALVLVCDPGGRSSAA